MPQVPLNRRREFQSEEYKGETMTGASPMFLNPKSVFSPMSATSNINYGGMARAKRSSFGQEAETATRKIIDCTRIQLMIDQAKNVKKSI